jgi:hypothetical protein
VRSSENLIEGRQAQQPKFKLDIESNKIVRVESKGTSRAKVEKGDLFIGDLVAMEVLVRYLGYKVGKEKHQVLTNILQIV